MHQEREPNEDAQDREGVGRESSRVALEADWLRRSYDLFLGHGNPPLNMLKGAVPAWRWSCQDEPREDDGDGTNDTGRCGLLLSVLLQEDLSPRAARQRHGHCTPVHMPCGSQYRV